MAKPLIFGDKLALRLPTGLVEKIEATLEKAETRQDWVRLAIKMHYSERMARRGEEGDGA